MTKKKSNKSDHYIDNQKFFDAMRDWKILVDAADKCGTPHPPVTEYIGECFMKIAENLSRKPNFINYPYRDEMISDGIENCLLYAYNFNPLKSKNPFSYFTQIIYYAFLRRIQKEKKQAYIKLKQIELSEEDSQMKKWFRENYLNIGSNFEPLPTFLTETDIEKFDKKSGEFENSATVKTKKPSKPKSKKASKSKIKKATKKGK